MRIIIVDNDPIVCESLRVIIEEQSKGDQDPIQVVATGFSGEDAIRLQSEEQADILILDIRMDPMDGIEAGRILLQRAPETKLLYLTTFLDDEYIIDALKLGAKGYLMKSKVAQIVPALRSIQEGRRVFGDEVFEKLPSLLERGGSKSEPPSSSDSPLSGLTKKEWALLELVSQGKNNSEIAEELHFSVGTVRNYLSAMLEKTGLRDRTQLAIAYYKDKGRGSSR